MIASVLLFLGLYIIAFGWLNAKKSYKKGMFNYTIYKSKIAGQPYSECKPTNSHAFDKKW